MKTGVLSSGKSTAVTGIYVNEETVKLAEKGPNKAVNAPGSLYISFCLKGLGTLYINTPI